VGRGVCAPPGRVAQPRFLAADRGYSVGAVNRGRLFFGYFNLGEAKESDLLPGNPRRCLFQLLGIARLNPTYMLPPAIMRTVPLCGIISPCKSAMPFNRNDIRKLH